MVATDKLFVGKIPEIYDRLLVPLLFESYARDLAERVANVKPQEALETAAGTGVLTHTRNRIKNSRTRARCGYRSQPADARSCRCEAASR